jgi:hypothetical protein
MVVANKPSDIKRNTLTMVNKYGLGSFIFKEVWAVVII